MYYQWFGNPLPEWMSEFAVRTGRSLPLIEPPLMETLAAATYVVTGEHLWVARAFASVFWVLGALAVYAVAARIASRPAGLASAGLYLFLPFAISASRGFQPDPLMTSLVAHPCGPPAVARHAHHADRPSLQVWLADLPSS